jgi:DNA primase
VSAEESRAGVRLTNLDQPLFAGAGATKRDLVDYLDAVCGRLLPELAGRPLSVIRVLRGQQPFMQKKRARLSGDLIEEGRAIPVARVQALHESKRRARARRTQ